MFTGLGIPVTRILVLGCTANFKPLEVLHFLSNQRDFRYVKTSVYSQHISAH